MPNSESTDFSDDEPRTDPIRIAEEFIDALSCIYSERVLTQIKNLVSLLAVTPEIGSSHVRPALSQLYGPNLRKMPVSTFVIVYRFDGECVDVLALVYGPTVK